MVKYLSEYPEIFAQWHPDKNVGLDPSKVAYGSNKKVWWLCPKTCPEGCKHEWQAIINNRNMDGSGCPFCLKRLRCEHESLEYKYPDLVKLLHPDKNGRIDISNTHPGSDKIYWWLCPKTCPEGCPHEWRASLKSRTRNGTGCPHCFSVGLSTLSCIHYSLAHMHSEIAKLWHPTKNGDLKPSDVKSGCDKKVWWLCECKHEWFAAIVNRSKGNGCPNCVYKTEKKIFGYLHLIEPEVIKELKVDWCKSQRDKYLPFDFCIEKYKLIIELDGPLHFRQIWNWKSPEEQQKIDIYKMNQAIMNGYSVIRIILEDVLNDRYDWKGELLKNIKLYDISKVIYMCQGNEYDTYEQ